MNRSKNVWLKIIIFPPPNNGHSEYDESVYGRAFSDLSEIKINEVVGGYTILYRDDVFQKIDIEIFGSNVINIFSKNVPNQETEIEIYYYHKNNPIEMCVKAILELDEYFTDCEQPNIDYVESPSIKHLIRYYESEDMEDDYDDEEDEDEDEDEIDFYDIPGLDANDIQRFLGEDDDDYEDFDGDSYPILKERPEKKSYGRSRLIRDSKKAKRSIKRHNILVSSDKEAKKKDKKVIKDFLKDFIPGKSPCERYYRAELLERWMDVYVISKKMAKEMAKEHKKESKSKNKNGRSRITREGAMDFTKKVFYGYDPFYDPNK